MIDRFPQISLILIGQFSHVGAAPSSHPNDSASRELLHGRHTEETMLSSVSSSDVRHPARMIRNGIRLLRGFSGIYERRRRGGRRRTRFIGAHADGNSSVPGVRERHGAPCNVTFPKPPPLPPRPPARPEGTMSQTTTWDARRRAPAPRKCPRRQKCCPDRRRGHARAGRYLAGLLCRMLRRAGTAISLS